MVELSEASVKFVTEEVLTVHAICDRAGVPRTTSDGELLSMSQRVHTLERVCTDLNHLEVTTYH